MFTHELIDKLNPLSDKEWGKLFAGYPDCPELVKLVDESGMDGFQFYSIVCRLNGEPVVVLPLFEVRYPLSCVLEGRKKTVVAALEKLLPSVFVPRVLGVGFVEGELGQIGINTKYDVRTIRLAIQGAIEFFESIAKSFNAQIMAFKDFAVEATFLNLLPRELSEQYSKADSLPYCQINTQYQTLDEYLGSLPRKVRQDLRRKMRQSDGIKIAYAREIEPFIDRIYSLYLEQVERSDMSLGIQNKRYFREVCATVPGAQYLLFFAEDELIAFNLIISADGCLVDKYVGMDSQKGRANNIYFLAWLEKIKYCIENQIPLLLLGTSAEDVKVRLGADMVPCSVLFRHRNRLINFIMSRCVSLLSYKPLVVELKQLDNALNCR